VPSELQRNSNELIQELNLERAVVICRFSIARFWRRLPAATLLLPHRRKRKVWIPLIEAMAAAARLCQRSTSVAEVGGAAAC